VDIYTGTILISLIVYIAVGNYAGRRVKKLDDYYVAGRRAPTMLIVGTLVASLLTTNMFLGETGFVYEGQAGPYLLWPPMGAMGYIFGALLFGRYLRRSRALTMGDYFGDRFQSRRVKVAAGITIIFGLGGPGVPGTRRRRLGGVCKRTGNGAGKAGPDGLARHRR